MNCKKHPRYMAKRYPRSECRTCLKIWNAKGPKEETDITAASARKLTAHGKRRMEQLRRQEFRAEEGRRK